MASGEGDPAVQDDGVWRPAVPPRVTSWKSPSGERKYARIPILSPRFETGSSNSRPGGSGVERSAVGNPGSIAFASSGSDCEAKSPRQPPVAGSADDGIARNVKAAAEGTFPERRISGVAAPPVQPWRTGTSSAEVLVDDVGRGCRVGGLVALAGHERRAVGRGEDREAEARDEEGRRDGGAAGIAGERQRGEPERDRSAAAEPAEPAERREQEPGRGDGGGEGDERRHEQDERARSAPGERARVHRAARVADRNHDHRCDRGDVERRDRDAAELEGRRADGQIEQ